MKRSPACGREVHTIARRSFLGVVGAGLFGTCSQNLLAELKQKNRRVLVLFLAGGVSQLESWDPKPRTDTGGPFRAIPTAVPGMHISELLPKTATHMDKLALIRGINTRNGDHAKGKYQMLYGRNEQPGIQHPHLGAVLAKGLERPTSPLPGHVHIPSASRASDAAYLGPQFASIGVNGKPPANSARRETTTAQADDRRQAFRRRADDRFFARRQTAETDAYTQSFDQALQLMEKRDVFDLERESAADHARYGQHDFGQHCLMARRLLDNDIPYVQVTHRNYDTHNENFNFHLEQLAEFDTPFSCLLTDLQERGQLDSTLVVVMSEFGRTPKINVRYGRDHWGTAWSICLGGAGIQPGAIIGKTNENGTQVIDREVNHGDLFHTYLCAAGLDSASSFDIGGRPMPLADPAHGPIRELLK